MWSTRITEAVRRAGGSAVQLSSEPELTVALEAYELGDVRADRTLELRHGEPMIFGKERDRGIILRGTKPEIVSLGEDVSEEDLLVHDETDDMLGYILSRMFWPDYPVPIGVIRRVKKPTHHQLVAGQIELVRADKGEGVLRDLLFTSDTWEVT